MVASSWLVLTVVGESSAAETGRSPRPPEHRCQPGAELGELSGLASKGDSWYAVNDGGTSLEVYVLDPADCSVTGTRTGQADPYDVEDLAIASDGALWLADTGDNSRHRESVAFHVLEADGSSRLYRVTYPDGPHDAEALLLDSNGVPYIVTKEPFGRAEVYRPGSALTSDRSVPLEHVTSVGLSVTDTPGGPLSHQLDSIQVTGAALSQDGKIAAIRTYTDAYLYPVNDDDLATAFREEPVRVPLPKEPQGEAIAWEGDGTLLSGSEGEHPISAVTGAAALARDESVERTTSSPNASSGENASSGNVSEKAPATGLSLALAGGIAALIVFVVGRMRRR